MKYLVAPKPLAVYEVYDTIAKVKHALEWIYACFTVIHAKSPDHHLSAS